MSAFERDKILNASSVKDQIGMKKIIKEHDFIEEIAQSSDMLPNDFSTASLLKNTGSNLTASKLSQSAGRDYRLMILKILQK